MSAEADRRRSAVFFAQYLALLAGAVAWVQFPEVRARVGGRLPLFYLLLLLSACYVFLRAYVVLVRQAGRPLRDLWVTVDLGVITGAVYLTGGMNSEAGLLYFWPIATSAIQRQPKRTVAISVASGLLYLLATWSDHSDPKYPGAMMARFVVLIIVSSLAVSFGLAETVRIEEVTRLREQVAEEEERSRLAQEVHDGILSYLDAIPLRLDLAWKRIDEDSVEAARVATDQRFTVRQAIIELRCLTEALRASPGERPGLVERLQHHLSVSAERSPLAVRLETEGEARPLPPGVEKEAFRIVQEAMINAEKYARATEVRVRLCYAENSFICTIRDDGVGFDTTAPPKGSSSAGFGLPSMMKRAEEAGGELRIASAPGQGTEVVLTVPFAAERPRKGG
jgi:signal transduction histidine kinase